MPTVLRELKYGKAFASPDHVIKTKHETYVKQLIDYWRMVSDGQGLKYSSSSVQQSTSASWQVSRPACRWMMERNTEMLPFTFFGSYHCKQMSLLMYAALRYSHIFG